MEDLIFAIRYSLMPNMLEFCGSSNLAEIARDFKRGLIGEARLKKEIKSLEAYYAYISMIGKKNSRSPFDKRVVEAYWIGNELLEKVTKNDLRNLILHKFTGNGKLSKKKGQELVALIPEGCVPHHSFHTLYLHSITGKLPPTIENLNNCIISWGEIKKIEGDEATVTYRPLIFTNNFYSLDTDKEKKIFLKIRGLGFIKRPKINDWVSIHWNLAIQTLTDDEKVRLEKYTLRNINAINSAK